MDKNLVFLTNTLMNPQVQRELNLPLTFITFGITFAHMYHHQYNQGTFILRPIKRQWGNPVVYGAVFLISDADYYWRVLDAYHLCSMSMLMRNHVNDRELRERCQVVPIHFSSMEELSRLQYTESNGLEVQTYFGNPKHPRISERLNKTNSYRIQDGLDSHNFRTLYEEVQHANRQPKLHGRVDGLGS